MKINLEAPPCPKCLDFYSDGAIRWETIQPLPQGRGMAPISRRSFMRAEPGARPSPSGRKICRSCARAEGLMDTGACADDAAARVAVGNEFQEALRMPPGMAAVMGLRLFPDVSIDDFDGHHAWLDRHVPEREGGDPS